MPVPASSGRSPILPQLNEKYILIPVFLGLATNTFAASEVALIKKGMSYQTADASLRPSGWHQRAVHTRDGYQYIGSEKTIKEHGVKGLESCAMDKPVCIVHYAKNNNCLRVITWGEQFKDLKIDSRVQDCPAQDAL